MPKSLFLFDGGAYKRGIDSGRSRVPLTPQEAELVFHDPCLAKHFHTSISTEFNMKKYASELCNLEVDDEIFVAVVPDAAFYRGLWIMSFDAVPGLTVNVDLVSVKDVYAAYIAGDATGLPSWNTAATVINYDFANGVGHATKDACDLAQLYGGSDSDYRNNDGLVARPFNATKAAQLGESLYIRITITGLPASASNDAGCCSSCGEDSMPTFQVGAVYDVLGVDKQRVRKFCNCPENLCDEGCVAPSDGGGVIDPPVGTAPIPTLLLQANSFNADEELWVVEVGVDFDQPVSGLATSDFATSFANVSVPGTTHTVTAESLSGSGSSYVISYAVSGDALSDVDFIVTLPSDTVTGTVGGLGNVSSNTLTIPLEVSGLG